MLLELNNYTTYRDQILQLQLIKVLTTSIASIAILIQISGCATLSESECKTANWQIIGLEDGSQGRPTSYIGEHRKACSEYTISPDLNAYLEGHQQGLKQYCTEANGYQQGVRGKALSQVCSGDLATNFSRGHQRGLFVYQAGSEMRAMQATVDSMYHRLEEIERNRTAYEEELVRDGTSEYRRRELLDEIKELERESESILIEIDHLKPELERLERNYHRLIGQ